MHEATLTVPAEHRAKFRNAAMQEAETMGQEAASWTDLSSVLAIADRRGAAKLLERDLAVVEAVQGGAEGELVVQAEPDTLAHICERMARYAASDVSDATRYSPMDVEALSGIAPHTRALQWASEEAARLHGESLAQREGMEA